MSISPHRNDREPLDPITGTPAAAPTATGDDPNPVERPAGDPTHDEIAGRAYDLS
jgi:hypothetical protein